MINKQVTISYRSTNESWRANAQKARWRKKLPYVIHNSTATSPYQEKLRDCIN